MSGLVVAASATIRQAMEAIERGGRQIALVVDHDQRLLATVTDGDIRRGLLRGVQMEMPVTKVMRTNFTAVTEAEGRTFALQLMKAQGLHQVPILDEAGRVVDLAIFEEVSGPLRHGTRVVLMAGGLGMRLRPLTENLPKPMVPIGGKPLLELILSNFTAQGFHDFTISLNYKGEIIREYFGDGRRFNARIDYVEEAKRMGTAGALSLLENRPEGAFLVMNADVFTQVPFGALLRFHGETGCVSTMCARSYQVQVPYGVIEVEGAELRRIVEKPTHSYLVNAGIYVLSPEVLDHVAADEFLDMPNLFERIIARGQKAAVFPIEESWVDIGQIDDLRRAQAEFSDELRSDEGRK